MNVQQISCFVLAGIIRFLLLNCEYQKIIADRVEVSTALNSWKKVTEGVYLQNAGILPYDGDLFHESPIGLFFFALILRYFSTHGLQVLFVLTDLCTALILAATAKSYGAELLAKEEEGKKEQQLSTKKISEETSDSSPKQSSLPETSISSTVASSVLYVPAAYLFNPYVVLNCVGLTTTVFTNFLLSIALYSMVKRLMFPSCLSISLLTLQGLYPVTLMVPTAIYMQQNKNVVKVTVMFLSILSCLYVTSYWITGSWVYLKSTTGFILTVPDLRPNVGLYWYFFTEMFEHFRWLFVASFQINVGLLYIVPLALRLRGDPMLLAFSYLAIGATFKSYPCLGDIGFYMALLPLWKHLFRYMQQGFIVSCFLLFCTVFAPTVWHQWIYSRSANANFYFGVTLAFAIAQIFLLTDVLFASIKREFSLRHGLSREVQGNKAKLLLE